MSDYTMVSTYQNAQGNTTWDYLVDENGNAPIISGTKETEQQAIVAAFQQQGLVPQSPNIGVPWTQYFTKQIQFSQLDAAINIAIANAGISGYSPSYSVDSNGKLIVDIIKNYQGG